MPGTRFRSRSQRPVRSTAPAAAIPTTAAAPPGDLVAAAARLRGHPGFRPALAGYCRGMTDAAPIAWPAQKLFDQYRRYLVCYMLIHNWHAWTRAGGAAPTLAALQAVAGASARQVAEFVAMLSARGFVAVAPDPADRRAKLLTPAPALVAEIGRSARLFVGAVDAVLGRRPGRADGLADADRLGAVLQGSAAFVQAHGTLIHPFPRVLRFAARDCGYPLLCAVIGAHYAAALPDAARPVPLGSRALAERFGVSPAHVASLLAEARRQGWFSTAPAGRLAALAPDLLDEFEHWASWQMAHYDALVEETEGAEEAKP